MTDADPELNAGSLEAYHASLRRMFMAKSDLPLPDELLRSLRIRDSETDGLSATVAGKAAGRATGREVDRVEAVANAGTFHQVYIAWLRGQTEPVVVRLGRLWRQGIDWGMHADAIATSAASAAGVGCATTVRVDTSRRWAPVDMQVCRIARGHCLRKLDGDDKAITPHLAALARMLRRVHEIEGSKFGFLEIQEGRLQGVHTRWSRHVLTRLDDHLVACQVAGLITTAEIDTIRDAFARAQTAFDATPTRLLHGDCGNHNVFTGDGHGPVLIDWEDALIGDPTYDLAMWATFHPERRWAAFFEAYGTNWNTERFWLLYLRIALAKTVHRLRFGYTDTLGRPPASERIQRALAALAGM